MFILAFTSCPCAKKVQTYNLFVSIDLKAQDKRLLRGKLENKRLLQGELQIALQQRLQQDRSFCLDSIKSRLG